jgi:hypothetical protein
LRAQSQVELRESFFGLPGNSSTHHQCSIFAERAVGSYQEEVCGLIGRPHIAGTEMGHIITSWRDTLTPFGAVTRQITFIFFNWEG